ncbi:hypothetical protein BS627_22675 [Agrobacterium salinitolerans]|nr:hypothetical protein BS627_22675 [Agrobacterium salinitolerans]PNQ19920.1 hypothetical protein C2E26_23045 [Rhizobium sp. YIC5082]
MPGRTTPLSSLHRKRPFRVDLQLRTHPGIMTLQHDVPADVMRLTIRSAQRLVRFTEGSG